MLPLNPFSVETQNYKLSKAKYFNQIYLNGWPTWPVPHLRYIKTTVKYNALLFPRASYCNIISVSVFNPVKMDFNWFKRSLANLDTMKKLGHGSTCSTRSVSHFAFQQQPQDVLLETRQLDSVFSSRDWDSRVFALIFIAFWDHINDVRTREP